ncbi:hypothetical protein BgiMline_020231 [Biomphalaria glabrata]|nr:hypothetical protein BgiMline_017442 [Biomphalaria glabrata]
MVRYSFNFTLDRFMNQSGEEKKNRKSLINLNYSSFANMMVDRIPAQMTCETCSPEKEQRQTVAGVVKQTDWDNMDSKP